MRKTILSQARADWLGVPDDENARSSAKLLAAVSRHDVAVQEGRGEALRVVLGLRQDPSHDYEGALLLEAAKRVSLSESPWAERAFAAELEKHLRGAK